MILVSLAAACRTQTRPAEPSETHQTATEVLYFPATGHTVSPPFSAYYLSHDGLTQFGYPITEALNHEGWQVQYFQYVRLEVHPENHPDYFITVGWLGQLRHRTLPPQPPPPPGRGRYFPETGHAVYGDFLTYFQANGDTVRFGRPIGPSLIRQGLLSQDFQSARLLWRPDLPPSRRVQLAPLGETYFLASDLPRRLLEPVPAPPAARWIDPPGQPLPPDAILHLLAEPTPDPSILRVKATVRRAGVPGSGYNLWLAWDAALRQLPPTNPAGETHTLIPVEEGEPLTVSLLAAPDGEALITYHHRRPDPQPNGPP